MTSAPTVGRSSDEAARLPSIDVLRTVAICLMIVVHFVENLAATHDAWSLAMNRWMPAGAAAPLFTFLAGVNYRLWCTQRIARGTSPAALSKATIRRGLFLIGTGFAFNVLVWLPEETFNWDVLTFVGLALISLDVVRRMPVSAVALALVLVLLTSPVLRVVADYPSYWSRSWFDYDVTLSDVALGCLVVGYFPLAPWLVFPWAGYLATPLIFGGDASARGGMRRPLLATAALGAISAVAMLVWPHLPAGLRIGAADGWTMFPASTAYVLGSLAITMLSLTALHRVLDRDPSSAWTASLVRWTGPFSRHSFSIYVLHHLVHIWPLWIAGLAVGDDPTALWQVAMPAPLAFALALACIVGCVALFAWVDRARLPSLEGAMRWLCD